jgi:hypothetical protein
MLMTRTARDNETFAPHSVRALSPALRLLAPLLFTHAAAAHGMEVTQPKL